MFRGYADDDGDGIAAVEDCDDENEDVGLPWDWYVDHDDDGYGGTETQLACDEPAGFTAAPGDCDDTSPDVNPNALESCNEADDDCDVSVDEGVCQPTSSTSARKRGCGCGVGPDGSGGAGIWVLICLLGSTRRSRGTGLRSSFNSSTDG